MKTKSNIKVSYIIVAVFLLTSFKTWSQMSCSPNVYSIVNQRGCDVAVHWEVSNCAVPNPNIICAPTTVSTPQIISAGGVFTIPVGCCGVDISVYLIEIDGVNVMSQSAHVSGFWNSGCLMTTAPSVTGTAPTSCAPAGFTITWGTNSTIIN